MDKPAKQKSLSERHKLTRFCVYQIVTEQIRQQQNTLTKHHLVDPKMVVYQCSPHNLGLRVSTLVLCWSMIVRPLHQPPWCALKRCFNTFASSQSIINEFSSDELPDLQRASRPFRYSLVITDITKYLSVSLSCCCMLRPAQISSTRCTSPCLFTPCHVRVPLLVMEYTHTKYVPSPSPTDTCSGPPFRMGMGTGTVRDDHIYQKHHTLVLNRDRHGGTVV